MIVRQNELQEYVLEKDMVLLEISNIDFKNFIMIKFKDIQEFFDYASSREAKEFFFTYSYFEKDEYIIPNDWYSKYPKSFKNRVKEHNNRISNLDFSKPYLLKMFILIEGALVGFKIEDNWMQENDIFDAEETIEILEDHFSKEVSAINKVEKKQRKEDEQELINIMINDPEFKNCKNQHLRHEYLADLLSNENMKKFNYLVDPFGAPQIGKAKNLLDKAWMLYKEKKGR